jgi:hypothetical protein
MKRMNNPDGEALKRLAGWCRGLLPLPPMQRRGNAGARHRDTSIVLGEWHYLS